MLTLEYPQNISRLVFRGFLSARVHIGPQQLTFKSINENEWDDIELYSGFRYEELREIEDAEERDILYSKYAPWILTWATLLVGDENILPLRVESGWFRELVNYYKSVPSLLVRKLLAAFQSIQAWYEFEILNVERFTIEPMSRAIWDTYRNLQLNLSSVTTFPGTEWLGLNKHQVMFKHYLGNWELRTQREHEYDLTKFLMGAWTKSVRQIDAKDRARRNLEKDMEKRILEGSATRLDKVKIWKELEQQLVDTLEQGGDEHDHAVWDYDQQQKMKLLADRAIAIVYSAKYGRKLIRQDMGVIGYSPHDDLPLGQYDQDEVKGKIREAEKQLNELGKMAKKLEVTDDQLSAMINSADQAADQLYQEHLDATGEKPEYQPNLDSQEMTEETDDREPEYEQPSIDTRTDPAIERLQGTDLTGGSWGENGFHRPPASPTDREDPPE